MPFMQLSSAENTRRKSQNKGFYQKNILMKEDDLVLCTVKRIEGTTVFVEIEGNGQGSLSLPEIAAGRIRNLRDYVAPNKKIVCKILRFVNGHPELSLRRVSVKERDEVLERFEKEKNLKSLIKSNAKDFEKAINKIKERQELAEFYDKIRENPHLIEPFVSKEEAQKLIKILSEKKDKEKEAKKLIHISSNSQNGINDIKEILQSKDADIRYLGSSKFSIIAKAKDFKEANAKLQKLLSQMEKKAKEKKVFFEIKN
jgi:translation initiation factor 2 alpha subunit (eIF-2alpha)